MPLALNRGRALRNLRRQQDAYLRATYRHFRQRYVIGFDIDAPDSTFTRLYLNDTRRSGKTTALHSLVQAAIDRGKHVHQASADRRIQCLTHNPDCEGA